MNLQALTVFPIPQFAVLVFVITMLGWYFFGLWGALICFLVPIVLGVAGLYFLSSLMPH